MDFIFYDQSKFMSDRRNFVLVNLAREITTYIKSTDSRGVIATLAFFILF